MFVRIFLITCIQYVQCVPPTSANVVSDQLQVEFSTLKNTIKVLSDQWEKWNTLFLTSLEPRITSTASTLASIDSNIHNLQERAHVWDTFQLHVSAWNEQLASLDRKIDIISKGQEKVLLLDGKINTILSMEYRLENTIKLLNNVQESVTSLDSAVQSKSVKRNHDVLLNEFASRGVLSSVKMVEKKLDRLLLANQNAILKNKFTDEKPKLTLKCNTPKIVEELLNDISSKVDIIFDNISNNKDDLEEVDYEEYLEVNEGSGDVANLKQPLKNKRKRKSTKTSSLNCKQITRVLENILNNTYNIQSTTSMVLNETQGLEKTVNRFRKGSELKISEQFLNISKDFSTNVYPVLGSYFSEQRAHFESIINRLNRQCYSNKPNHDIYTNPKTKTTATPYFTREIYESYPKPTRTTMVSQLYTKNVFGTTTSFKSSTAAASEKPSQNIFPTWKPIVNQNKSSCEDLDNEDASGVYIFENNVNGKNTELFFNKRYCEIRNDGLWTLIQRRDNYTIQNNFNISWEDYKYGFGDLHRDFWMGNDFLHNVSNNLNLVLRVELEDFENNKVWAEYDTFIVASERENYKLTIGGYNGNSSDSFSSHNGAFFSTYDRSNDEAPECCPCALSYGGGWWFNKCFECNLNGVYYKKANENHYFRGIIWEHWLGNYSLKKSIMMVKSKGEVYARPSYVPKKNVEGEIPYYEDP